jgi:hypothetical protein
MDWGTLTTVLVTSIFAPWIAKHGFALTPDQTQGLTVFLIGAPTAVAHWFETRIKQKKAATVTAAAVTYAADTGSTKPDPAVPAPPSTTAKMIPLLIVAGAVLATGGLTGCATAGKFITPTVVTIEQGVADVAVATAVSKGIPALQIKTIAQQLLALDNGTTALSAIEAVVTQKLIAMKLPPGDLAAAQLLTQSLTAAVTAKLSTSTAGSVNANTQVAIADVLNAVITATSFYGV